MAAERRIAERKNVDKIIVADLTSLATYTMIASSGNIIDASTSGFLMLIDREDIAQDDLRQNITLEALVGQAVVMYLPQMNLDLDGTITRASHRGKGQFEIAVEFSNEVPEYWKECLIELLPEPGEIAE